MKDAQTGIAIRFIKQFDAARAVDVSRLDLFSNPQDAALFLAMQDKRDVSMAQKIADAYEYICTMSES